MAVFRPAVADLSGGIWVLITVSEEAMAVATKEKNKKPAKGQAKIQPLGDRVLIEREASEKTTSGGIVLPDSAKDKPSRGTIVAVGDGKLLDDGKRHELQVKVGDR